MTAPFYFIAYSSADAADRAIALADQCTAGPPSIPVWLDERKLQPGIDRYSQVLQALKDCQGVLFVLTRDSTDANCPCTQEWIRALKYKKPVVPLLFDADAELPFQLEPRVPIPFVEDFDAGLARLREHVRWRATPQGQLHTLQERLKDARRDLAGTRQPADKARIDDEIAQLKQQIDALQASIANPDAARERAQQSIERGLERERQPDAPVAAKLLTRFINRPPLVPPSWFQNRHVETALIGDFLRRETSRLMIVVGRGGTGKTALACRLLRSLEGGKLPDDGGELAVDGIVYLSSRSGHPVNFPNLFYDLCRLLPEPAALRLDAIYKDTGQNAGAQMQSLLAEFPGGRTIVLLDNFEDVVDAQTQELRDAELDEALRMALEAAPHGVKFIVTTRVAPQALMRVQPGLQDSVPLDEGLGSPYAENVLKAMDPVGTLGLNVPGAPLAQAREATRGFPRALEALVGILRSDRNTDLPGLLAELRQLGSRAEDIVRDLVGEAFNRLDPLAQETMQALAVYGVPVPAVAVDFLLQPYRIGVDSSRTLGRLVGMQFVRGEAGRYHLHQVDRDYALSRVAEGVAADREADPPPLTRFALRHRGAEYFKQTRKPREAWKSLDDLAPQLAEFDLRVAGDDFDAAGSLLVEIDYDYLSLWGHYRLLADRYRGLHGRLTDPIAEADVSSGLGSACLRIGEYVQAQDCFERCRSIAHERGDRPREANALVSLGWAFAEAGEQARSLQMYEQALIMMRELGDKTGEAVTLGNIANRYSDLGRLDEAVDTLRQAVGLHQAMWNHEGECRDTYNLASALYHRGDDDEVKQQAERARDKAIEIGYRLIESAARNQLAYLALDAGRLARAQTEFQAAADLADAAGAYQMQQEVRIGQAWTFLAAGNPAAAQSAAEAAVAYRYPPSYARCYVLAAIALLHKGDRAAAGLAFDRALTELAPQLASKYKTQSLAYDRALALAGLALCREPALAAQVAPAYRDARAVCNAAGVVAHATWQLKMLSSVDPSGLLQPAQAELAGPA